jgi:hypothetical protein
VQRAAALATPRSSTPRLSTPHVQRRRLRNSAFDQIHIFSFHFINDLYIIYISYIHAKVTFQHIKDAPRYHSGTSSRSRRGTIPALHQGRAEVNIPALHQVHAEAPFRHFIKDTPR